MILVICDRCKKEVKENMKKYVLPVKVKRIARTMTSPLCSLYDVDIIEDKTVDLCKECQEALVAFMEDIKTV